MGKKLSKQKKLKLLKEEQQKFNRQLLLFFFGLLIIIVATLFFYTYGCSTWYIINQYKYFSKEVPSQKVCMIENQLKHHETSSIIIKNHQVSVCSKRCELILLEHTDSILYTKDALTNKNITKSSALIGLKKKGLPDLIYFENKENLDGYYTQEKQKKKEKK